MSLGSVLINIDEGIPNLDRQFELGLFCPQIFKSTFATEQNREKENRIEFTSKIGKTSLEICSSFTI